MKFEKRRFTEGLENVRERQKDLYFGLKLMLVIEAIVLVITIIYGYLFVNYAYILMIICMFTIGSSIIASINLRYWDLREQLERKK